uniref:Uncharacterized protein n=1 Tax=Trypanosoma vivax (strain Y486) TaxID=1055687 RepID=G0TYM0_TRYVY|nr:conserved hypothetical protein [Trypanosoma vivax Y486]
MIKVSRAVLAGSSRRLATGTPFTQSAFRFFRTHKRDIFFSCVALIALGSVVNRELMVRGVVPPPGPASAMPVVERQFGKQKSS